MPARAPSLTDLLLEPLASEPPLPHRVAAFDAPSDTPLDVAEQTARPGTVLVFDGLFLHRHELHGYWDLSMWIDGQARVTQERTDRVSAAIGAGPDGLVALAWWCAVLGRSVGGMALYQDECRPEERADAVVGNDDVLAPTRFDAFLAMWRRAADAHAASGGSQIVTDIVIDQETFGRTVASMAGAQAPEPDPAFAVFPTRSYRCSTLDGNPVDPTQAVAHALNGHIRRAIIGSDSVVVDLGRRRRLFTGAAALAVKLSNTTCYWPGCEVPVTDCQCDHLTPWDDRGGTRPGGCTCPGDGAPACGRHNLFKEHGYTVHRDATGCLHVHRPDGTEIE